VSFPGFVEAGKKVDYGDQGVTVEGAENDLAVLPAGGCRCQQVTAVVAGRRVALDPLRTSFRQPRLGRLSAQESRNRKRPVASTLWILRPQPWGGDPAEGQSGAAVLMGARLKRPAASQTAAEPGEGAADAEKVGVVGAQREPERDLANARYDRPDACDLWVIGKEVSGELLVRVPTDCPLADTARTPLHRNRRGGSRTSPETASDLLFLLCSGGGI
jgi:hypothetical protein